MDLSYYKAMEPFWGAWRIKRLIGEGSFGKVFEIEREDFGRTYRAAMKVITIPQNESEFKSVLADGMDLKSATSYYRSFVEEVVDEFALMAGLKGNSNIVSYEDHTVIEHKDNVGWDILIRMELLTPLLDYTGTEHPMERRNVIKLGIDMCRALEYCQKQKIIHRDIKPENIFVSSNGDYKLGDFGIARTVEKTTSGLSRKGTYTYMAPEVYRGEKYGATVDIYSLGIVLYRLLNYNRTPFLPAFPAIITHSDRENAIARRVGGEPIPMPSQAQDRLGEIILRACAYAPGDRYATPEQLRQDLEEVLKEESNVSTPAAGRAKAASAGADNKMDDWDRTRGVFDTQREAAKVPEEGRTVIAGKSEEDWDADATVSLFGDVPEEPDLDNPTIVRQERRPEKESKGKKDKKQKDKKKKGRKTGLFVGIGAAAVLVIAIIAGSVGKNKADDSIKTFSVQSETEGTENRDVSPVTDTQEEEGSSAYNPVYYGYYSLEGVNSSSVDPENSFLRGMDFQEIGGYELSVVPSSVKCFPDGSQYDIGYNPNMALGMSKKEVFQRKIIQQFEGVADQTEAFYEENIEGQRDCVEMRFHHRNGSGWTLRGYYKMRGSVMEVGFPYVDEAGKLSMEIVEFTVGFSGINLEISRNGYTNTLVPFGFQEDRGMVFLSGYASSGEDAYMGISHILISGMTSDSPSVYVNFENGDIAIDPIMKLGEDNTVTISWREKWHNHARDINTTERISDGGSITFQYLSCEDIGFIMQVDGRIYLYQKTRAEYFAEELQDSLEGVSYQDIEQMNESKLQKAEAAQNRILEALQTAFDETGIDVNIDERSGKVTMSNSVLFGFDDAELSEEGKEYLMSFLMEYEYVLFNEVGEFYQYIDKILVEGHTDSTGDYDYNQTLSEERAVAVRDYFVTEGVNLPDLDLEIKGCSSDNLIYDEEGNEDSEASRRVELKIILDLNAF